MSEYLLYLFSMSFTPGPNVILCTANGSQKGFPKCLTLCFGMVSGIFVILTICYFAVTYLVLFVKSIDTPLRILGVVYLLWLSYCFFSKGGISTSNQDGGFKKGFLLQFVNVKLWMMCITSCATFVLPLRTSVLHGYFISLITPFMAFLSQVLWSLFGVVLTRVYSKYSKFFNFIFGISLLALAVSNVVSLVKN